jgi:hypothetical protein
VPPGGPNKELLIAESPKIGLINKWTLHLLTGYPLSFLYCHLKSLSEIFKHEFLNNLLLLLSRKIATVTATVAMIWINLATRGTFAF